MKTALLRAPLFFCFGILFISLSFAPRAIAASVSLHSEDARWIAGMIFQNECDLRTECLTTWNEGEDFPSLGIGHFIWYSEGQQSPFHESFPEFLDFLKASGREVPDWLNEIARLGMPWKNREQFLAAQSEEGMMGMRQFLQETMEEQAFFMMHRFQQAVLQMIAATPEAQRTKLAEKVFALTQTRQGLYAMIDYLNFKGDGLSPEERYREHGWGLFQVLYVMDWHLGEKRAEEEFVEAARKILRRRVDNAPSERAEDRWIAGWVKRIETYSKADYRPDDVARVNNSIRFPKTSRSIEVVNFADFLVRA